MTNRKNVRYLANCLYLLLITFVLFKRALENDSLSGSTFDNQVQTCTTPVNDAYDNNSLLQTRIFAIKRLWVIDANALSLAHTHFSLFHFSLHLLLICCRMLSNTFLRYLWMLYGLFAQWYNTCRVLYAEHRVRIRFVFHMRCKNNHVSVIRHPRSSSLMVYQY